MDYQLIQNNTNDELIVFLLGWGMDPRPLLPLANGLNVLFLYNFTSLDLPFDFSPFSKIKLIAYSYGVMMTALLADKLPPLAQSVAVNGTFEMSSPDKGLPAATEAAIRELSLDNYLDFRRKYLIATDDEFKKFNENGPLRSIESCITELDALRKFDTLPRKPFIFDKVLISDSDHTLPTENQKKAWAGFPYKTVKGNHFPFYQFSSLNDLFD